MCLIYFCRRVSEWLILHTTRFRRAFDKLDCQAAMLAFWWCLLVFLISSGPSSLAFPLAQPISSSSPESLLVYASISWPATASTILFFFFFFWSPFSRSPAQNTRVSGRRVRDSQPAGSPNPLLCARISSQISQGISSLGERRVANAKLERFVRDPCGRIYELESVSISQKLLHFFSYHTLLPPRFIQSMLLLSLCYIKLAGATDFTLLSI